MSRYRKFLAYLVQMSFEFSRLTKYNPSLNMPHRLENHALDPFPLLLRSSENNFFITTSTQHPVRRPKPSTLTVKEESAGSQTRGNLD